MDENKHLVLLPINIEKPRRKRKNPTRPPSRDYRLHGEKIKYEMKNVIKKINSDEILDPSLIFKVIYKNPIDEKTMDRTDLKLLSNIGSQETNSYVLFSSDNEMRSFLDKLGNYQLGIEDGKKSAFYDSFFSNIDSIEPLSTIDRTGHSLKKIKINPDENYWINVELWHLGNKNVMRQKVELYRQKISELGGIVTDDCIGESFCLLRVHCNGKLIEKLLRETSICEVDLIPDLIMSVSNLLRVDLDSIDNINDPESNSTNVCVIDSGIVENHPLISKALKAAIPFGKNLDHALDETGHGTLVASIALYGDLEKCIQDNEFTPNANLLVARVLDKNNEFPKEKLIENQISESISTFLDDYECRIFNLSIGIGNRIYDGGKQLTLAQRIDELCRKEDLFICISAGNFVNYPYDKDIKYEKTVSEYPYYLLFNPESRLIDPATASLAMTVGSISKSPKVTIQPQRGVENILIARHNEPSPFTRVGYGINNSVKPDICTYGGNIYYDSNTKNINNSSDGCGIIGCNYNFIEENKLFSTKIGTSFAAPQITNLAAKIKNKYSNEVNFNTIRALIANSCEDVTETIELINTIQGKMFNSLKIALAREGVFKSHPSLRTLSLFKLKQELNKLDSLPKKIINLANTIPHDLDYMRFTGYGIPNEYKALNSYDKRVTMYAQDKIELDNFKIYEIFVPHEILVKGTKIKISVSLAFSPPTRHNRKDYLGYDISYKLMKNISINDIVEQFRKRSEDEEFESIITTSQEVTLTPGTNHLKNSTLKSSKNILTSRSFKDNRLYLVVFNEKKWFNNELNPENFSVVVSLEYVNDELNTDLYALINDYIITKVPSITPKSKIKDLRIRNKTK